MRKLVVISHTEHQLDVEGNFVGWGPTINEINYLSQFWEEVVHVACLEKNIQPRGSSIAYSSEKIKFVPIPTFGGKSIIKKLEVIWKFPLILKRIQGSIKDASHVQVRVPMGIGIFLIPYFVFRVRKRYFFWAKYANNWGSKSTTIGYRLQRAMLKRNWLKCKVTINGFWQGQQTHCISLENPCLNLVDNEEGLSAIQKKIYSEGIEVVFIGRVDESKGADFIIELIKQGHFKPKFIHIVGEGKLLKALEDALQQKELAYKFYGTLRQPDIFRILNKAHAIILPSKSEGFPKVLAEAMNFGCIPITSNVGSICHYIKHGETGIVMNELCSLSLEHAWKHFITLSEEDRRRMTLQGNILARKFTFEEFGHRLINEVLN